MGTLSKWRDRAAGRFPQRLRADHVRSKGVDRLADHSGIQPAVIERAMQIDAARSRLLAGHEREVRRSVIVAADQEFVRYAIQTSVPSLLIEALIVNLMPPQSICMRY